MEPMIYIDVVFLVSCGMDAFLLWAAGRIAGFSAKKWRVALGGFLGALLYCLWLCFFRKNGGVLLSFLLVGMGLCVAYYPKSGRNFMRLLGGAWAVSFLLGGGVNILFTMTQAQRMLGRGVVIQKAYPSVFTVLVDDERDQNPPQLLSFSYTDIITKDIRMKLC